MQSRGVKGKGSCDREKKTEYKTQIRNRKKSEKKTPTNYGKIG